VIPEYQTWEKDGNIVQLVKNHGGGGYYVNVQGSQKEMDTLKEKLDGCEDVNCQWNPAGVGSGKVLTVREVSQKFQGVAILMLIGSELDNLGYSKI